MLIRTIPKFYFIKKNRRKKILYNFFILKNVKIFKYTCKIFIIFFLLYLKLSNISIIRKRFKPIKKFENNKDRIFVIFMYNNEAEMAYIHIWRLYHYVNKFIMIISNMTHSGLPKNFSLEPYEEKIKPYMDKVDIINFNNICNKKEYNSSNSDWCLEKSQRDYGKTYIEEHYNPTENDLFISVDIDEIFTREGIEYIKQNPPEHYYNVKGSMYFPYYYHKVDNWDRGMVIRYNKNMTTLSNYRDMEYKTNTLKYQSNSEKPFITHCSYCFKSIDDYRNKLKSFAHQEYNQPPYTTNNWLFKSHYCREKINSFPGYDEPYEGWKHLIPNDPGLKYLIDPSFMYPINLTTYTMNDLENLCSRKYRRTPFE